MLLKYISNLPHVLETPPVELKEDLLFEVKLVRILDQREKVLRNKVLLWKSRRMIYLFLTQAPLPLAYYSSSTSIYKAKPSTYFYRFSSVKTCHFLSLSILLLAVYRVKLRLFLLTGFFGPILSPAIRAFCLKSHEVERMASSLQNQGKTNLLISWLSTSTSSLAAGDPK